MSQNYFKASLKFRYKQLYNNYKDAKIINNNETSYQVIRSWWLSSGVATEEGIFGFSAFEILALSL